MFRSAMLLLIVSVFSTGCASVGPGTIKRDHFNYSAAIGQIGKEELLRNIVRLRYLDAPVFLCVNSIINQYSLDGSVSLSALNSDAGDAQTLGGTGRWSDQPTITYTPLSGHEQV